MHIILVLRAGLTDLGELKKKKKTKKGCRELRRSRHDGAASLTVASAITRFLENFKKIGKSNLNPSKIRSRINVLKEHWFQYQDGHDKLVKATAAATRTAMDYFKEAYYDNAEDVYHDTLDYMVEKLEEMEPTVSPNQSLSYGTPRAETPALPLQCYPAITLPPFDGKYEEWEPFRDRFNSLVRDNKELSNFARMHYLASCVKGRALECISDLSVTADNFPIAWKTLASRFEKKRRLINVHLATVFDVPSVAREQASDLRALVDKVSHAVAALNNLSRAPADLWNDVLVYAVVRKLDSHTRRAWNLKVSDSDDPPTYDALKQFLVQRTGALEEETLPASGHAIAKSAKPTRIHAGNTTIDQLPACPLCNAKHFLYSCSAFESKTPIQRRDIIKKHNRCFNCLSASHSVRDCRSKFSCRRCKQKHHSLLHVDSASAVCASGTPKVHPQPSPSPADHASSSPIPSATINSMLASGKQCERIPLLLATARVAVRVASGRNVVVRALLDQGSEMTLITENLAQILRAKRIRMPVSIAAVGGLHAGIARHATQITISPRDALAPSIVATALILKTLTSYAPRHGANLRSLDHLADLHWADSHPTSSDPIDLIIGADVYGDLLLDGVRKGEFGQPIAQNTLLGWVISGSFDAATQLSSRVSSTEGHASASLQSATENQRTQRMHMHHCLGSLSLDKEIRRFWEVEEVPYDIPLTAQEEQCETHFRNTHARDSTGRYTVRLPFRKGPPIAVGIRARGPSAC